MINPNPTEGKMPARIANEIIQKIIAMENPLISKKLVEIENKRVTTTSLMVAAIFEKEHKNVLRDIKNLECSSEFSQLNFEPADYIDQQGKTRPSYKITKDGFTFLVMGFTGGKASYYKEAYIKAFNEMQAIISNKNHKPQQIFAQHHEFAQLFFTNKKQCLEYANHLTHEQTGINILDQAGLHEKTLTAWAIKQKIPAMQKVVLLILSLQTTGNKGVCASHRQLATDTGMTMRSILNQIDALEKSGLIEVVRQTNENGERQVNKYLVQDSNQPSLFSLH